nr:MAG TPA: hypothetical protein [Bacteriophage sp.]
MRATDVLACLYSKNLELLIDKLQGIFNKLQK